jgi:protein-S-isoprenylcysteine O-methyltransferase Ste14
MVYRLLLLIIGLFIAAYWARVLQMAAKARQKTGRAANFFPPERLGRVLRMLWIPAVVIWVAHPFADAAMKWRPALLRPLLESPWIAGVCVVSIALCFQASRICWRAMGRNWRMGIDPNERTGLVLAGPYAWVRHPIYALSQAMMVATMLALPSPLMLAAGAVHILLLQWEARREELHMRHLHGQMYVDYCQRVGRFVPAMRRLWTCWESAAATSVARGGNAHR